MHQLDEFLSDYYDGKLEGEVRLIESYSDEEGVQRILTDFSQTGLMLNSIFLPKRLHMIQVLNSIISTWIF